MVGAPAARADDWADCQSKTPAQIISGCTSVIQKGGRSNQEMEQAYRFRADTYVGQRRYEQAISDFDQSLKIEPNQLWALVGRGLSLIQTGRHEQAFADLNRAIELDPKRAFIYMVRGQAYGQQRDWPKAIADYSKSIELNPDAGTYAFRCAAYLESGDLDRALMDCDRTIALTPTAAEAYYLRGNVYRRKGSLDSAIAEYGKAISFDGKKPQYFSARAEAFSARGAYDRAVADYDRALLLRPNDLVAQGAKMQALALMSQTVRPSTSSSAPAWPSMPLGKAESDSSVAATTPGSTATQTSQNAEVRRLISEAENAMKAKQRGTAIKALDNALQLEPDNPLALLWRSTALVENFQPARAVVDLERIVALRPAALRHLEGYVHARLGGLYKDLAAVDKALAAYSKAIEINPKAVGYWSSRGLIYLERGDLDRALVDFNQALVLSPDSVLSLTSRGVVYEGKGQPDLALKDYDRAIALDPDAINLKQQILGMRNRQR